MKLMDMLMPMGMTVWVTVMIVSTIFGMKDFHDVKVATKTENWSQQHVKWLLNDLFFNNSVSGLNEKLNSDTPNYGDIY